MTIRKIRF